MMFGRRRTDVSKKTNSKLEKPIFTYVVTYEQNWKNIGPSNTPGLKNFNQGCICAYYYYFFFFFFGGGWGGFYPNGIKSIVCTLTPN